MPGVEYRIGQARTILLSFSLAVLIVRVVSHAAILASYALFATIMAAIFGSFLAILNSFSLSGACNCLLTARTQEVYRSAADRQYFSTDYVMGTLTEVSINDSYVYMFWYK